MAYGTPKDAPSILEFYTDIRRGRPPSDAQLDDLVSRYNAIGGLSPMNAHTEAQVAALQRALDAIALGEFRTYYGAKHVTPRIEDAVAHAAQDGCDKIVGLVLAPHFSKLSVGEYIARAKETAEELRLRCAFIESWHEEPALIEALSSRVEDAVASLPTAVRAGVTVVITAHSLPQRILETGDPYPSQIARTGELIAEHLALKSWMTGWQSAGRTAEPWLGPDITDTIQELADKGVPSVVVCACGFTSDHLEVLFDLDISAKAVANRAGIAFARTASINADQAVFDALATRVSALSRSL